MPRFRTCVLASSVLLFVRPAVGHGQHGAGLMVNIGYSQPKLTYPEFGGLSERVNAVGLAGGLSAKVSRFVGFAALDTSVYRVPGDSRYYIDTFSNGQSRCRDRVTGRFAVTELCNDKAKTVTAGMFDGNVLLWPIPVMVGAGYRTGLGNDDRGAYGAIGYAKAMSNSNSFWFLRGTVGRTVAQVNVGVTWHWPSRRSQ